MNLATGSFTSVTSTENAVNALHNARFDDDHIGLVVRDEGKGSALATDLKRKYSCDGHPHGVINGNAVDCQFSDDYIDTVHDSNLGDPAIDWYRQQLDQGQILLIVDVEDRMDDADRIIHDNGGLLFLDRGKTAAMPGAPEAMAPVETIEPTATVMPVCEAREEVHIPVIDEEIAVERMPHKVGEVEVTSETTSETIDLPTTIVHQEIRVERRKLDRALRPDEYQGATIEKGVVRIPIVEDELRVTKEPVIREELIITRQSVSEQKTVHETVSHTEPHIETTGDIRMEGETEKKKRRPAA